MRVGQPSAGRHLATGLLLGGLTALATLPAAAQPVQLGMPIDCKPGQDCWVVNYVDLDPGPGRRDYHCGVMSYDKHNGTDFAIRDLKAMAAGVPVLATADGVVRATRDEMEDANFRDVPAESIAKRECGNGVVIEHGDGWQTQYCHMRRGSVRVKPKDRVSAGQRIGLVGMSGKTEFPHVHVTVRHAGKVIDPFVGNEGREDCRIGKAPLWKPDVVAALPYKAGAIHIAGIVGGKPDIKKARAGDLNGDTVATDAEALIVWAEVYNVVTGDTLSLRLLAPDGKTLMETTQKIEKDQARVFRSAGRRRPGAAWPAGTYRAEITYARDGKPVSEPVGAAVAVR